MNTVAMISEIEQRWSGVHSDYRSAVENNWPKWETDVFRKEPTPDEYRAALDNLYRTNDQRPPPWAKVKDAIFQHRKAGRIPAPDEADQACGICESTGCFLILIHRPLHGRRRVLDAARPQPVPGREIMRGAIPCICRIGQAVDMGWLQDSTLIAAGKLQPKPGVAMHLRQRLVGWRVGSPWQHREYADACQAMIDRGETPPAVEDRVFEWAERGTEPEAL